MHLFIYTCIWIHISNHIYIYMYNSVQLSDSIHGGGDNRSQSLGEGDVGVVTVGVHQLECWPGVCHLPRGRRTWGQGSEARGLQSSPICLYEGTKGPGPTMIPASDPKHKEIL